MVPLAFEVSLFSVTMGAHCGKRAGNKSFYICRVQRTMIRMSNNLVAPDHSVLLPGKGGAGRCSFYRLRT